MIRGFSCAILLLCAWLLSGCEKFAIVPVNSTPTPAFSTISIPERTLEPESIVNLTIADITGTIATQNQVAIIWTHAISDVVSSKPRYIGLLDITASRLLRLNAVIDAGGWMSGQWIKWSPDGTKLMYLPPGFGRVTVFRSFRSIIHTSHISFTAPLLPMLALTAIGRHMTGDILLVQFAANIKVASQRYMTQQTGRSSAGAATVQVPVLLLQ